ncbi:DMT family transporter [Candidatus Syntrophosphaera thermopropionivorans]|uniref:DMT family transporter n=1 Tax=Candidatus Syntrophosphaera thermopropionivorans TaxID=2593015 RepID=A0AC61QIU8_9BACT|nr:DMT family transporter [Candidatus Syntrophosphaera thermopropionivorans]TDF72869.1 DMT family transporter [Candidatus Syntrophosphaera thermopropionivorans]
MHKTFQKAYYYAFAAILAWSTVSTAFKLSLRHLTPLGLLLISSLCATIFLAIIFLVNYKRDKTNKPSFNWKIRILSGLLNPFIYYLMLFEAYHRLRAQEAQVLNYTWAIVLSFLSALFLKQKLRIKDIIALFISFFGVLLVSTQGRFWEFQFDDPVGSLLAVSTSLVWAFYWILNMKDSLPAIQKLLGNFLIGTLATFFYALILGKLNYNGLFSSEANITFGILGGIYVGIFEMGLTFLLWQKALEYSTSTASTANLIFLTPFLSLIFIFFILKEHISPATLIGLVLIVLSNWWQKSSRPAKVLK